MDKRIFSFLRDVTGQPPHVWKKGQRLTVDPLEANPIRVEGGKVGWVDQAGGWWFEIGRDVEEITLTVMPDNPAPDRFEREAAGWIRQELEHDEIDLRRLESNVIDTYRMLIRFPDRCPGCTRNGRDHDMECPTQEWEGPDRGLADS